MNSKNLPVRIGPLYENQSIDYLADYCLNELDPKEGLRIWNTLHRKYFLKEVKYQKLVAGVLHEKLGKFNEAEELIWDVFSAHTTEFWPCYYWLNFNINRDFRLHKQIESSDILLSNILNYWEYSQPGSALLSMFFYRRTQDYSSFYNALKELQKEEESKKLNLNFYENWFLLTQAQQVLLSHNLPHRKEIVKYLETLYRYLLFDQELYEFILMQYLLTGSYNKLASMAEIEIINETLNSFSVTTLIVLWLGCNLAKDQELANKIFQNTKLSILASTPEEYNFQSIFETTKTKLKDKIEDSQLIQENPTLQVIIAKIIEMFEAKEYLKVRPMIEILKQAGLEVVPSKLEEILMSKAYNFLP